MAMTGSALVIELGARTEGEFTSDQCVTALNAAQDMVVGLADKELLFELMTSASIALTGTTGETTASLATINAVNNMILSINQETSPFMEYELIDKMKANKLRRTSFLTPTRQNPKGYIIGQAFYSLCSDDESTHNINVEYIGQPTAIENSSTVADLNPTLREPLLLAGEAFLWRTDDELERANDSYQKFIAYMGIVNEKNLKSVSDDVQIAQAKEIKKR